MFFVSIFSLLLSEYSDELFRVIYINFLTWELIRFCRWLHRSSNPVVEHDPVRITTDSGVIRAVLHGCPQPNRLLYLLILRVHGYFSDAKPWTCLLGLGEFNCQRLSGREVTHYDHTRIHFVITLFDEVLIRF